jgi:adenine-specific DNA-methyltransferase
VKVTLQDGQSLDIQQENIEALQQLFPELVRDGKVNFDVFLHVFGDLGVLEEGEEKFGLNWHGKKKARQNAFTPSLGTLLPCPHESVDWDTTQNLFIEGDNLEVLKLLQKSYANSVSVIYIDPPYNTGHGLIYPDNFVESLDNYLIFTNQKSEGITTTSATEKSGRKHSTWLSMMYPRLTLSKSLLGTNGVIFISIDDGEYGHLKLIMDEIFGEENFIGCFVWKSRVSEDTRAKTGLSSDHEYIVCYRKNDGVSLRGTEKDLNKFSNPDNDSRGNWRSADMTGLATKDKRPNLHYDLINPETGINYGCPPKGWRFDKNTMAVKIKEKRILWPESLTGRPRQKLFLNEMDSIYKNISSVIQNVSTADGTREINSIFKEDGVFDFPKPTRLIENFIEQIEDPEAIILDFFAGSGTTAQAVMNVNAKNKSRRRFIAVQLPEPCEPNSVAYKLGFNSIAEITKQRITVSGENIKKEFSFIDSGFKVFKLAQSNIQPWNVHTDDLENTLDLNEDHLIEGRTELDVLYELLLKRGIDLATPIEKREINSKTLYSIGYGAVFACLDDSILATDLDVITSAIIEWHKELAPSNDTHIFFKDSAFQDDVVKTNLAAILEQNGLKHVRSL